MRLKRKKIYPYTGLLFILPSLAGVSVFVLIPFADVVRRSFLEAVSEQWVGLKNYMAVFQNPAFQLAAVNTLRFIGVCMPLLILLSLLISVFLHKQLKYGYFLKMAYLIPMAIPVASVVLLWQILFHEQGMLNGLLAMIGISPIDWMQSEYAFGVLVFSYIWKNVGYDIVLWMAGLSSIPADIYEAAKVDGAGEWNIFWKITLPNLLPISAVITVLSLLNSFKVFREAYLVAGSYPHESMYLLQHLFNNWYRELSLDKLTAAAVVMALVITLFVIWLQKGSEAMDE